MATQNNKRPFLTTLPAPETLWTPAQTAATLQVKEQTLAKWRCTGKGPRFTRLQQSSAVRYRPSDVAEFINGGLSPASA